MEEKLYQLEQSAFQITNWTREILENWGVSSKLINLSTLIIQLSIVIILVVAFQWIANKLISILLQQTKKIKRLRISDFLIKNKFPRYLALTAPLIWVRNSIPVVFEYYPNLISIILKGTDLFIVWMIFWLINSIIKASADYLLSTAKYKDKPIESYFQVVRILFLILTIGATFTILSGQELVKFFATMGAASAVMMLVFKDSILGFVASIQVVTNDMVRIGDWITMPKYHVDGDVKQITLTTVKVKNFDKTISTIPTYALVSDSFQNWRGMSESGGRRIKRAITLKQSTIKFVGKDNVEQYKKIGLIEDYIENRQLEIEKHNEKIDADMTIPVNGRSLTNIGLFRKYIETYLKMHNGVNQNMSIIVRQLAPDFKGLPIEIYCFTSTTNWTAYENIMADIFDHLTAAVQYFDLEIFEDINEKMNG